jgi:hypothetical protein
VTESDDATVAAAAGGGVVGAKWGGAGAAETRDDGGRARKPFLKRRSCGIGSSSSGGSGIGSSNSGGGSGIGSSSSGSGSGIGSSSGGGSKSAMPNKQKQPIHPPGVTLVSPFVLKTESPYMLKKPSDAAAGQLGAAVAPAHHFGGVSSKIPRPNSAKASISAHITAPSPFVFKSAVRGGGGAVIRLPEPEAQQHVRWLDSVPDSDDGGQEPHEERRDLSQQQQHHYHNQEQEQEQQQQQQQQQHHHYNEQEQQYSDVFPNNSPSDDGGYYYSPSAAAAAAAATSASESAAAAFSSVFSSSVQNQRRSAAVSSSSPAKGVGSSMSRDGGEAEQFSTASLVKMLHGLHRSGRGDG